MTTQGLHRENSDQSELRHDERGHGGTATEKVTEGTIREVAEGTIREVAVAF